MATTTTRLQLSPHFTIEEFDCHDGTRVPKASIPALKELCQFVLEPMREKYGSCRVHSGYRTVSHNASVGDYPSSGDHFVHVDSGPRRDWHG